jgi:phosphatidylserine decarboxylase
MAKDALYFLIPLGTAAVAAIWAGWPEAGIGLAVLAAFVAFFFRDPHRVVPAAPGVIVSPADGRVVRVEAGAGGVEVSIFLSLFDVHINRSPIEGQVQEVEYRSGSFHAAFRNAASAENERNTLTISNRDFAVTCSQIAGLVARRIVCWKKPGDAVGRGERIGLIRFGSRVDLTLPPSVALRIRVGDKVRGGSSTIAVMEAL